MTWDYQFSYRYLGGLFFFTSHPIERKSGTLPARALAAAVLQQQETLHSPEPSSAAGDMKRLWIATVQKRNTTDGSEHHPYNDYNGYNTLHIG